MKFLIYKIILLLSITIVFGCKKTLTLNEVPYLINGFWEIEKVETKHSVKQYKVNTTVDYFYINKNGKGYRFKAKPSFLGKYKTNTVKDTLQLYFKNDSIYLKTITPFDTWKEVILSITSKKLVIKNDANIIYHYKKHQKFDID